DRVKGEIRRIVLVGRGQHEVSSRTPFPDDGVSTGARMLGGFQALARGERSNDRAADPMDGHGPRYSSLTPEGDPPMGLLERTGARYMHSGLTYFTPLSK